MLKKLKFSVLTLFVLIFSAAFTQSVNSQNSDYVYVYWYDMPNARAYAPQSSVFETRGQLVHTYYAKLPGYNPYWTYTEAAGYYAVTDAKAARIIIITNEPMVSTDKVLIVKYKNYKRPSHTDALAENEAYSQITWMSQPKMPVKGDKQGVLIAPHGYNYKSLYTPGVDKKTYSAYDTWNTWISAAGNE